MDKNKAETEWKKHPKYMADAGGLFGAPPQLVCQYCHGKDYELFYGHCRECAEKNNIPQTIAEVEKFQKAIDSGSTTVIEYESRKWWSWRYWFNR